jgi:peptidoglycan-associated lipoprotein
MKLAKISKLALVSAAIIGLSACASNKKDDESANQAASQTGAAQTVSMQKNDYGFLRDDNLTVEQLLSLCTYYFKFDSTELAGANLQAVQAQGNHLAGSPEKKVLLKGYTDVQGSREYNIALGYRRAQAVANELMTQGTNKKQIEMVSYGPEFPQEEGNSQESYQKNRRVELAYCDGASCKSVYGGGALKGAVK